MTSQFVSSSNTNPWSGGSMTWNGVSQLLEESFVQDFDSTSPEANLRAIRSIRNFITANPINKWIIVQNDLIRGRIMSLTAAFSTHTEYTATFKRDFLCMYASFLRESPTFAEEICKQRTFLIDLLSAVNLSSENTDPPLREAILLFLKTLFEADNLDKDFESVPAFKRTAALEVFTAERLANLICLCEALFDSLRRGSKECSTALVCLTKLLALLATNSTLAERNVQPLLRFAHRGVMATVCPRHAPLVNQDRSLILPFDAAKVAPCPEGTAYAVARFSLKILFFAIYHVPMAFEIFKTLVSRSDPLSLISIYSHLSQPYSRCHLAQHRRDSITLDSPFNNSSCSRHRNEVCSDPLIYYPRHCFEIVEHQNSADGSGRGDGDSEDSCGESLSEEESVGIDDLSLCSPDGAFGLSGTADKTMCLLVGLLRGVLFCRYCSAFKGAAKKESDGEDPVAETSRVIVARDRFGNETVRSDGLGLSDDQISLLILQPLTQHSLPLSGTGVNTWACHIAVLVLKQRQSLHHHLLYSQLLTSEFDDTVTCLLKALQPTCDYEGYADFLEQLIPFSRLFACMASTCEDVRVRIGELSMIRAFIQMFVTHPSLATSSSIISMNLTLAVCQLLHALSRSIAVIHTVFSDVAIIDYLIELSNRFLLTVNSNPCHAEIALATTSTLVNLQLCQLPDLDESRVKSIDVFHSLLNMGDGESSLSLRLNGLWGLSNAAAITGTTRIPNRAETVERLNVSFTIPKALSLCDELLSRIGDCEMRSAAEQGETKVVFETSGSVLNSKPDQTHLKAYLVQKALLLLRNMLALKEVNVPEYSESVYLLLAKVFASNQSVNAKYEAMMILANLLTNADARSQFWLQTELIQSLVANITINAEMPLICGAILMVVNILDVPEPLATTVGGDSLGELFTQILSLLLFDDSQFHRSSYKQSTTSSWCRHSSFHSSSRRRHRTITTITTNTVTPTSSRQSPEAMETTDSPTAVEVGPQEKALLRLITAFLNLFHTYSDSSSTIRTVGSSMTRQIFKEVWDWQYQCGRGNGADSDDEQQQQSLSSSSRRRCKRFAFATASTSSTSHYRSVGGPVLFVRRQEEVRTVLRRCLTDPGSGLKAFLTGLMKELNEDNDEGDRDDKYEEERSSRSSPRGVDKEEPENSIGDVFGASSEQEGGKVDEYEDN